jgi:photosystem II stability/assembly factor-like uncharacterized protein
LPDRYKEFFVKKSLVIIAFLCLQICLVYAQNTPWQLISPTPQAQPLNGLWAVSPETLVAVGNYGTILRSANGGATWNVQQTVNADTDYFNAVQFVSGSIGWVAGDDGVVLKTTDGGFSWVDQGFPLLTTILAIKFISPTTGWVTGSDGVIYKTTDGGTSWIDQSPGTHQTLFAIEFANSQVGYAFGTKGMSFKTTNGGTSWVQKTIDSTETYYSANFLNPQLGWIVGLSGAILKTTNGGQNWIKQTSPIFTSFFSVHFIDSLNGIIGGSIGSILKTTNSGATWTSVLPDLNDDVYAIRFATPSVAWAVGDVGRILKSTDGGNTWKLNSSGVKADLFCSYFPSLNIGYAVGDTGVIVKTTDGGLSWNTQHNSIYQPFYGVFFATDLLGWAVGDSGVVLKTTDGGNTWVPKTTNVENTLYSIYFANSTDGWAVGSEGVIIKTANGGSTWTKVGGSSIPPNSLTLTKVRFFNSNIGLLAASDGSIWKSTNGGGAWLPKSTGIEGYLYSISWPSDNIVYAVGDYGVVIQSTDAGETWNDLSLATPSSYYDVAFFNNQIGWAVGDAGEIIVTTNSGQDWYEEMNPALTSFFSVQAIKSGSGALIVATGASNTVVSSSIQALTRRNWTGAVDSLWMNPLNWNPSGVPNRLDSVYIPFTSNQPVMNSVSQQINIGSLALLSGASLKIKSSVAQLSISGSISSSGTIRLDSASGTQILTGGDLVLAQGQSVDQGKSTFICTGNGSIRGTFGNLIVTTNASMSSIGNITILNAVQVGSIITMGTNDTLTVRNSAAQAFTGQGLVTPGTIKRLIAAGSTENYRFESSATGIKFQGTGVNPDSITMTTYSNSKPAPLPDSLFSPISFLITPYGGSNPRATLCLRYDDNSFPDYNISLFRDSSGIVINAGSDEFADGNYPGVCLDTTFLYSRWYVGAGGYIPRLPYQFRNKLIVSDNGGTSDTLTWGSQPGATIGLDAVFGEANLGSKPPIGTFDARWRVSPSVATKTNMLPMIQSGSPTNTYTCEFQPGPGGYPVTIRWNASEFPTGNVMLVDAATGGTKYKVYLKGQSSVVITDASVGSVNIIVRIPAYYTYYKNWNIISMAQVSTVSSTKAYNFPRAVSSAFGYLNGYYAADSLKNGLGYWLKFPGPDSLQVPIEGDPLTTITIPVDSGWTIIGSVAQSVAPKDILQSPSDALVSPVRMYGFKSGVGYTLTDSVRGGYGYWVKVNKHGSITLGGTVTKQIARSSEIDALNKLNTLLISDGSGGQQKLYFGGIDRKSDALEGSFELPPPPPPGILDASFAKRQLIAKIDYSHSDFAEIPVFIQSQNYPVKISLNITEAQIRSITVLNAVTKKIVGVITSEHNKPIYVSDRSTSQLVLKVTFGSTDVPKQFALLQNFPNPFNPSTTIRFQLPVQAAVTLELYNILGQRVKYLMNQEQMGAGTHDVTLDASSLASGVYFYQIRALGAADGSNLFHDVKKLLLVK